MGKLADQITTDCCGSLLDDKAQLVKDVAALEASNASLTEQVIASKADLDLFKLKYDNSNTGYNIVIKETCRTVFDTMYKGDPRYKEQVWANLCLTLGIEA
tara:strand:+ start:410 stop:712 length:303 start_codon:yes stop_codon:yes gene_type:complete